MIFLPFLQKKLFDLLFKNHRTQSRRSGILIITIYYTFMSIIIFLLTKFIIEFFNYLTQGTVCCLVLRISWSRTQTATLILNAKLVGDLRLVQYRAGSSLFPKRHLELNLILEKVKKTMDWACLLKIQLSFLLSCVDVSTF